MGLRMLKEGLERPGKGLGALEVDRCGQYFQLGKVLKGFLAAIPTHFSQGLKGGTDRRAFRQAK